jgi:hypothetical protein
MYDPHLHLFVDESEVEASWNVTPTIGRPESRTHDPIMVADRPWEGRAVGLDLSVLHDPASGTFRMWYRSHNDQKAKADKNLLNYAESSDGLSWTKPGLGLITYDGSTTTNIIHRPGLIPGCQAMETHGLIIDDVGGPQRRYKMPVSHKFTDSSATGLYALFSPDGIDWMLHPTPTMAQAGDRHSAIKDAASGDYVLYLRPPRYRAQRSAEPIPPGSEALPYKRTVARATSKDFLSWTDYTTVLRNDAFDTAGTEFYNIAPVIYGNRYIAFVNLYDTAVERMWVTLASSLDGTTWNRPHRLTRILDLGPEGCWDDSWVNISDNPPVREGDRMRFWYHGRSEAHGRPHRTGAIGSFVLGLDRFAGLAAGQQRGTIVTDRIEAGNSRLFLNANVRNGVARVAIRTDDMAPIPGLGLHECNEIRGDHVDHPVTWNGNPDLSQIKGERVRLHIEFTYGQIFAYRFGDRPRDLS